MSNLALSERLDRKAWTGEQNGRETACLLAALSPEAGAKRAAEADRITDAFFDALESAITKSEGISARDA